MKKKSKWRLIGYSIAGILIAGAAVIGYEFYQLQPANHFKDIPVASSGTSDTTNTTKSTDKTENTDQQTKGNGPVFNILLLGSDERPGETIGHSDTMMLAHVDLGKNQINAISIPRDTRVHLNGYGYTKLTSVQYILQADKGVNQGIIGSVDAISELTGVPINYYMETNFQGLEAMVDSMGGIDIYVPTNEKINGQPVAAGTHFVDGKTVLALARERHSIASGDYGRQQVQLEAIKGIAKKALNPSNISNLPSLISSMSKYMIGSNMSTSDMVSLGMAMKNIDLNKQIHYKQIEGTQKVLYDDILKANNDQIVIDPQVMKSTITEYFH
ncbi:LCP family protein [Bacillus sp. BRMEA1]|uniref:LCP family protein n=1 Tax=Neobacillus endophyticus TaxID=2738405 RepID=UPI0015658138|nr:LCP family protein [Neobacillus endophyticus]NRD76937.1 LCP family protein [Neobacillus endophyticus]